LLAFLNFRCRFLISTSPLRRRLHNTHNHPVLQSPIYRSTPSPTHLQYISIISTTLTVDYTPHPIGIRGTINEVNTPTPVPDVSHPIFISIAIPSPPISLFHHLKLSTVYHLRPHTPRVNSLTTSKFPQSQFEVVLPSSKSSDSEFTISRKVMLCFW
jgi:hypothetical protein